MGDGRVEAGRARLSLITGIADRGVMSASYAELAHDKRLMAQTAAAMFGGATIDAAIEGIVPGDPAFAIAPALAALVLVSILLLVGPRLPRRALAMLGPIGVLLIAAALATTPGAGDGAILYVWPVLWTTFFFGPRGGVAIVCFVGLAHAGTLLVLPAASSYPGRWLDVMATAAVLVVVTTILVRRNRELLETVANEARTDALTGLLNRRGFDERAEIELTRARRDGSSIAVVIFDIDYFKRINDEWGHKTGDAVLARTSAILAASARDIDVVARMGGEEFAVLMPECDEEGAANLADRTRDAVAKAGSSGLPAVRLSAGLAAGTAPETAQELLQAADVALYRAKRAGRDRTVRFDAAAAAAAGAEEELLHFGPGGSSRVIQAGVRTP
jgi:diguanylate cyclase (GGDEF)-like protein